MGYCVSAAKTFTHPFVKKQGGKELYANVLNKGHALASYRHAIVTMEASAVTYIHSTVTRRHASVTHIHSIVTRRHATVTHIHSTVTRRHATETFISKMSEILRVPVMSMEFCLGI